MRVCQEPLATAKKNPTVQLNSMLVQENWLVDLLMFAVNWLADMAFCVALNKSHKLWLIIYDVEDSKNETFLMQKLIFC